MTQKIDHSKVQWFVRKLHSEYERQTLLRDWCDVQVYFEKSMQQEPVPVIDSLSENEQDRAFTQIGQWTQLPIDIIQSAPQNEHIISDFVRQITLGERNFLIDRLDQVENIQHTTGDLSVSEFRDAMKKFPRGDTVILPYKDSLSKMRSKLRNSDKHYFKQEEFHIVNDRKIDIHWYPPDKDPKLLGHGYLINSSEISLVQKWHGDSTEPNFDHNEEYDDLSLNRPFMIYIGKETEIDPKEENEKLEEKIDFLYRTVFSEPDISRTDVLQFRL